MLEHELLIFFKKSLSLSQMLKENGLPQPAEVQQNLPHLHGGEGAGRHCM